MPIYEISTEGKEDKRVVQADSAAQAIRHCAKGMFTSRTVTKAEELAGLFSNGVALEKAVADADEPEQPEQPEPEGAASQSSDDDQKVDAPTAEKEETDKSRKR